MLLKARCSVSNKACLYCTVTQQLRGASNQTAVHKAIDSCELATSLATDTAVRTDAGTACLYHIPRQVRSDVKPIEQHQPRVGELMCELVGGRTRTQRSTVVLG